MNVYDFDNTIYDGESVIDFFLFYCKKDKSLLRYIPAVFFALLKYKAGKVTIEQALSRYGKAVGEYYKNNAQINEDMKVFWDEHMHKIKPFYKEIQSDDDLIISGSPEFSLEIICKRLGIKKYIGSIIEKDGSIPRLCIREAKVKAFFERYPDAEIDDLYTDSFNDKPLMDISKHVYLVKGNKIKKIK
ncbi:MAG: haloacid dehalogenase-like hydrolase [Clostridia bacterium]|nr:haloacid dehalogenase-like hydrolase [Clostridia bacterium]